MPVIYQPKVGLFGNKKDLQSWTNKLRQNHRQVRKNKGEMCCFKEKRVSWVGWQELNVHWGKLRSLKCHGFSLVELLRVRVHGGNKKASVPQLKQQSSIYMQGQVLVSSNLSLHVGCAISCEWQGMRANPCRVSRLHFGRFPFTNFHKNLGDCHYLCCCYCYYIFWHKDSFPYIYYLEIEAWNSVFSLSLN